MGGGRKAESGRERERGGSDGCEGKNIFGERDFCLYDYAVKIITRLFSLK